MTEQIEDKRTTNFKIWNGSEWVRSKGIINESLLCARPGCRHKPKSGSHRRQKKWCSTGCMAIHRRQLIASGKLEPWWEGSGPKLKRRPAYDKFLEP